MDSESAMIALSRTLGRAIRISASTVDHNNINDADLREAFRSNKIEKAKVNDVSRDHSDVEEFAEHIADDVEKFTLSTAVDGNTEPKNKKSPSIKGSHHGKADDNSSRRRRSHHNNSSSHSKTGNHSRRNRSMRTSDHGSSRHRRSSLGDGQGTLSDHGNTRRRCSDTSLPPASDHGCTRRPRQRSAVGSASDHRRSTRQRSSSRSRSLSCQRRPSRGGGSSSEHRRRPISLEESGDGISPTTPRPTSASLSSRRRLVSELTRSDHRKKESLRGGRTSALAPETPRSAERRTSNNTMCIHDPLLKEFSPPLQHPGLQRGADNSKGTPCSLHRVVENKSFTKITASGEITATPRPQLHRDSLPSSTTRQADPRLEGLLQKLRDPSSRNLFAQTKKNNFVAPLPVVEEDIKIGRPSRRSLFDKRGK